MILQNEFLDTFVKWFADSGAIMLVICGLMALVWFFYEGVRRGWVKPKGEEWERDKVSRTLKVIIGLGIILGVITLLTGIVTMVMNIRPSLAYESLHGSQFDWLTSIALIVMGIAMFLKPLEDLPLAALIGLAAGAAAALLWILFGLFALVATLVGVAIKFWLSSIEAISKFISWPPMALITAAFCLVQGFMVWITGNTIIMIG
ncbi:MAG: hypothetical protein ACTSRX_07390 [Promethearchaeota archaeon]